MLLSTIPSHHLLSAELLMSSLALQSSLTSSAVQSDSTVTVCSYTELEFGDYSVGRMYVQIEGMYTVDAWADRNICLNECMSGSWLLHSAQWACLVKQCVVWNHTVGQGCKMLQPASVSEATLLRTWRKSQFHISTEGRWKASCGICKGNRTLYLGLNPAMNKNKENLNFAM